MTDDDYDLERFVKAQSAVAEVALKELRAGRKQTHWMWFIFPQLRGLGHSATARFYGIDSLDEARAYLAHPVLAPRLVLCTQTVLGSAAQSLHDLFGSPDDMKFQSCMTLFEAAAEQTTSVFGQALDGWCAGARDPHTLRLINAPSDNWAAASVLSRRS
jgi:uncharacterized protein (DUF1810 family)